MKKTLLALALLVAAVVVLNPAWKTSRANRVANSPALPGAIGTPISNPDVDSGAAEVHAGQDNGHFDTAKNAVVRLADLIRSTPDYTSVARGATESQTAVTPFFSRRFRSVLSTNGEIYIGRVGNLVAASDKKDIGQWGVAEIAIEDTLFGTPRDTASVPYHYEDMELLREQYHSGDFSSLSKLDGSSWSEYEKDRKGLFLFVLTDGYDYKVFDQEEARHFGITRGAYRVIGLEGHDDPTIDAFRKAVELFEGTSQDRGKSIVRDLLSHGVSGEGMRFPTFELALEELLTSLAPEHPSGALRILDEQFRNLHGENKSRFAQSLQDMVTRIESEWVNRVKWVSQNG